MVPVAPEDLVVQVDSAPAVPVGKVVLLGADRVANADKAVLLRVDKAASVLHRVALLRVVLVDRGDKADLVAQAARWTLR